MKPACKPILILAACLVSPLAQAHDNGLSSGLLAGLAHPLTGLDHLAALVMSGFLIGRLMSGKRLALAALIGALGTGATAGVLLGAQAGVESLVLLSLPVLLLFQWVRKPGGLQVAISVTGLLMIAHGWVHGVEVQGDTASFFAGFLMMSTIITGLCAFMTRFVTPSRRLSYRYSRA